MKCDCGERARFVVNYSDREQLMCIDCASPFDKEGEEIAEAIRRLRYRGEADERYGEERSGFHKVRATGIGSIFAAR